MDSKQTYRLGGRHKSLTNNKIEYAKKILKQKKLLKLEKESDNCGRNKSQSFTKYMTKGTDFPKKKL